MADRGKLANVKVGAFVLTSLAIFVVGTLWIAGSSLFGPRRVHYTVLMRDSGGLQAGDRVRIAGVSVGRIQHVQLAPADAWPVTLSVAIKPDLDLRDDAGARVGTSGLLGASHLELTVGSPDASLLPPGGTIRGVDAKGLDDALAQFGELSDRAVVLLDRTSAILDTVSTEIGPILVNLETLLSEDNARELRAILTNLRSTTEETGPRLASLLERLEAISSEVEHGLGGLPGLTARLDDVVAGLQSALGPDGERLAHVLDSAETGLDSANDAFSALGGNRGELEATVRDLRDTVANLKAFSQQVKEHPFSLVRIRPDADRRPGDGVKGGSR